MDDNTYPVAKIESLHLNDQKHHDRLFEIILDAVKIDCETDVHKIRNSFKETLNNFIDHPHLLDKYLEQFFSALYINASDVRTPIKSRAFLFDLIYELVNFRGLKISLRFINHEEELDNVLDKINHVKNDWKARYCLMLWLISVLTAPFTLFASPDCASFRSIVQLIKDAIELTPNSYGIIISLIASTLFCRKDVHEVLLDEFFNYLLPKLQALDDIKSINTAIDAMRVMAYLFKTLPRGELFSKANLTMQQLESQPELGCSKSTALRKHLIKLLQRICMVYLEPKSSATLFYKPSENSPTFVPKCSNPKTVNDIIARLSSLTGDTSFENRYSCSKGLARIALRLGPAQRNQIIDRVLLLFEKPSHAFWQAACLCLAEFAAKGACNAVQFEKGFKGILRALSCEEHASSVVTGASVRDAACYALWSLARALHPHVIKPYTPKIVLSLTVTALFDTQLICRRSASAALQEVVGRQGDFPNGTELAAALSFQAVANVERCYLDLSNAVAFDSQYANELSLNLLHYRLTSIYKHIRELAAKSLGIIAPNHASYFIDRVVPLLFDQVSPMLAETYLVALFEVVKGLAKTINETPEFISVFLRLCDISLTIPSAKFSTFCSTEAKISLQLRAIAVLCCCPALTQNYIQRWFAISTKLLSHRSKVIRTLAVDALKGVYSAMPPEMSYFFTNYFKINSTLLTAKPLSRIGYYLFLTVSWPLLVECHKTVLENLINSLSLKDSDPFEVEAQTILCKLVYKALSQTIFPGNEEFSGAIDLTFDKFSTLMLTFLSNSTGDASRDLRVSALETSCDLSLFSASSSPNLKFVNLEKVIHSMLRLAFERDDYVKRVAFRTLRCLLCSDSDVLNFQGINLLKSVLTVSLEHPRLSLSQIMQLLEVSAFYEPILTGLLSSFTSCMRNEIEETLKAFVELLETHPNSLSHFLVIISHFCRTLVSDLRLIDGLLFLLHIFLQSTALSNTETEEFRYFIPSLNLFTDSVLFFVQSIIDGCRVVPRLINGATCLSLLLQRDEFLANKVKPILDGLSLHEFPQVREAVCRLTLLKALSTEITTF